MTTEAEEILDASEEDVGEEDVVTPPRRKRPEGAWRSAVAKRPALAVGAAFVGGILLAVVVRGRKKSRRERESRWFSPAEDSHQERPISGALLAAAAGAVTDVLVNTLVGRRTRRRQRA